MSRIRSSRRERIQLAVGQLCCSLTADLDLFAYNAGTQTDKNLVLILLSDEVRDGGQCDSKMGQTPVEFSRKDRRAKWAHHNDAYCVESDFLLPDDASLA